ncbi:hypothetical protein B0F90DRAFT_1622897 [Multifurca ochricompacta]|uniref:Uncharacterized protein n=1 Tax=Multifurca ochricompacta TaxID=376703 RepID=A0AAD4M9I3_9AGAM|nr:hypothetical protein B0F90DRAFT_1622897 [Multifurca ochricompacta]
MSNVQVEIDDEHPLALELSSLRSAVTRFQHEAHASGLKLQRHSLEAAMAIERTQMLEHENAAARAELAALRAHPDTTPHPAELQLPELSLALRRLSDKLTLAEEALRAQISQFADMQGAAARAHHAAENAFALAVGARAREEDAMAHERALILRLRAAEEEGRMMDRAVREYADLVRSLERRQSLTSSSSLPPLARSPPPAGAPISNGEPPEQAQSGPYEALQEEKAGLHKLVGEFAGVNEALREEMAKLRAELDGTLAELEAERKGSEEERAQLSNALAELERLKHDDNAAAKMVSRYMRFSQSTTDTLQKALESLKTRHAATTSTLHMQLASTQAALAAEQRQSTRLRNVLDEATEQLAREAYGRRREIALRLAVVGREDQLAEALRRWVRRAQETLTREDELVGQRLSSIVSDAHELLALVDGAAPPAVAETQSTGTGSMARIVVAQDAVKMLVEELQVETERRMLLERVLGRAKVDEDGTIVPSPIPKSPLPEPSPPAIPELVKVDAATSPIRSSPLLPPSPSPPQAVIESSLEEPLSLSLGPPAQADFPVASPLISLTTFEHEPGTTIVLHQPTPRSNIGSPAFLSPRSSPSPSMSIQTDTHSDIPTPLPLHETILASSTNEHDTTTSPKSPTGSISESSSQHPSATLLAGLGETKNRYEAFQRAFRDCHIALRELGETVRTLTPPTSTSLPISALETILSRLDDFNEDTRVELEIRVADEERIARGYETLLTVPGAIASAAEAQNVESAVQAFVDGSDAAVSRARNQFSRKRDDLEHDIAALKRAVHEHSQSPSQSRSQSAAPVSSLSSSPSSRPATPSAAATNTLNANASWTSLAAGLFAGGVSSRPASPSPTFGSVVTSLRARRGGMLGSESGPLTALQQQLRIPMPDLYHHYHHHQQHLPSPVRPGSRGRTTSGMYMLGLGMRSGVVPNERRSISIIDGMQKRTVDVDEDVE